MTIRRAGQATDDNTAEPDRPQMTIYHVSERLRFFMPGNEGKATDTRSVYVVLIAFPRQQRLCERVSLRCICTVHVVTF